ncbi:MAG: hypothetical protein KGZ94_13120, partial [Clostridia bacterium]|nr:hypothetical protein [Clostridia bacterium]
NVEAVDNEIKSLKGNVEAVDNEIKSLKGNVEAVDNEIKFVKNDLELIKTQQKEDHLILKALEHKADINKAEHDQMLNNLAYMEGAVNNVKENIGAIKEIIGRHEVDITVLKRRPV